MKKWVLNNSLNVSSIVASQIAAGSAFHSLGAKHLNCLSPYVTLLTLGSEIIHGSQSSLRLVDSEYF